MKRESDIKGIFSQIINICTRVTTLIFLFSTILMKYTNPDVTYIPLTDILYIILIGVISGLAFLIYYIPKNPGKKMMLFLEVCYFLIINVSVMFFAIKLEWINIVNKTSVTAMEIFIIVIYVIVKALFFFLDFREANKMNNLLQKRKEKKKSENNN